MGGVVAWIFSTDRAMAIYCICTILSWAKTLCGLLVASQPVQVLYVGCCDELPSSGTGLDNLSGGDGRRD